MTDADPRPAPPQGCELCFGLGWIGEHGQTINCSCALGNERERQMAEIKSQRHRAAVAPGIAPREPLRERIEALVRAHDWLCLGCIDPQTPYCSCAPEGTPLCVSCRKLADAIEAFAGEAEHEIRTLREQLENAQDRLSEIGDHEAVCEAWMKDRKQLAATRAALIALRPYLQHLSTCLASPGIGPEAMLYECTCGLDALTQAAGLPDEEQR